MSSEEEKQMRVKKVSWLAAGIVTGLFGAALLAVAADVDPAAEKCASSWLALVDAAKYDESWNEAHSMFKQQVTKDQWVAGITDLVTRLGKIQSRKQKEATATKTLPQLPPGDYVKFVYDSAYENLPNAVDTLIVGKDRDGTWRVMGYFVQPAGQPGR